MTAPAPDVDASRGELPFPAARERLRALGKRVREKHSTCRRLLAGERPPACAAQAADDVMAPLHRDPLVTA